MFWERHCSSWQRGDIWGPMCWWSRKQIFNRIFSLILLSLHYVIIVYLSSCLIFKLMCNTDTLATTLEHFKTITYSSGTPPCLILAVCPVMGLFTRLMRSLMSLRMMMSARVLKHQSAESYQVCTKSMSVMIHLQISQLSLSRIWTRNNRKRIQL